MAEERPHTVAQLDREFMKPIYRIILGVVLIFTSVWAGAYLLDKYEFKTGQNFPIWFTSFILCVAGWVLVTHGLMFWDDWKDK